MERVKITVAGIVQGVGFRPFVYNLARRHRLCGWVINDACGVEIEAEGDSRQLTAFIAALQSESPPLVRLDTLTTEPVPPEGDRDFVIRPSGLAAQRTVLISPDVATCPDCRRETADPANRRYRYPFTNCTNCGPRYTIIRDVPYDRERTTMAGFEMCPACQAEYNDPADRRFHAQSNACSVCGPGYRLLDGQGQVVAGEALDETRRRIINGAVVAIKGLGGYHLACDARNSAAVEALRDRKVRVDKPFAVMCGSLDAACGRCLVSMTEAELLLSPARPIVLLAKGIGYDLATAVAPDNPWLGVMLPYTPAHWLLLESDDVWVMTSGNVSDEPIAYDDADARERLGDLADYFLVHNRPIYCRADDSVARVVRNEPYLLRRSRGYAPAPLRLNGTGPAVVACGGELKATFCLTCKDQAFLSAHIGDLENMAVYDAYTSAIAHYQRLFDIRPELAVHDLHPEYLSTKYAQATGLPLLGVQHHHAHVAAVLAEYGLSETVIGLAFDGNGYGLDGRLWGGEFLLANCHEFTRLAHFAYLPLPGGTKSILEPWRPAALLLHELYGPDFVSKRIPLTRRLPAGWELMLQAAGQGVNTPLSSGVGRVFDIAAALLGLRTTINYEGQAAIELELAAAGRQGGVLPYRIDEEAVPQL
ncbi:MAG TPA: carbamoyltransferase HypF, partial [Negativicutes bacterium]|nr:carbamoyltransferase HypF [Negativicutes bacterium]